MKLKLKAAVGSLLASGALAGAAVMPASGQAGEVGIMASPGEVCNIAPGWGGAPVMSGTSASSSVLYYLPDGAGFRIISYGPNNTYYGRGNGLAEGYLWRDFINQSSCH